MNLPEFKLIVAGGREYADAGQLEAEIRHLADGELKHHAVSLVSGMARGADLLAYEFAKANQVVCYEFPANWKAQPRAAGFIRNRDMANFSDGLLAFWDGKSRGTQHMIDTMENLGKPVRIVRYES